MNMHYDISKMTLREKIGQTMCLMCEKEAHVKRFGSIEKMLEQYPIGALYACKGMKNGMMLQVSREEYQSLAEEYGRNCKIPLLKMGEVVMSQNKTISFGSNMGLGATGNSHFAYENGCHSGRRARAAGLDMLLSPVVDVNASPDSPVINTRAYGDNPKLVSRMARAYIRGVQEQGVAACAKHYPGPDDKETVDPHLAPTDNMISRQAWDATNGRVYREVIEEGVYTIMSGHQNLPSYQQERIDGRAPAATVSHELLTGLLKERLGFKGMIVTDALCMGGFVGADGLENLVSCLTAGNDMLLWPSFEYLDEVERQVLDGRISMERIDDAVTRVLELKEKLGLLGGNRPKVIYDCEADNRVSQKIADASVTLLRNHRGVLPAERVKKALVVVVTPSERSFRTLEHLKDCFAEYGVETDVIRDTSQEEIEVLQQQYDLVLFALCRTVHDPIGPLEFWGDNASSVWASNSADLSKTVTVSFGSPYSYQYYKYTDMTYINAYAPGEAVQKAVVERIMGKAPFQGISPVKL